jgi:hypothetical protein
VPGSGFDSPWQFKASVGAVGYSDVGYRDVGYRDVGYRDVGYREGEEYKLPPPPPPPPAEPGSAAGSAVGGGVAVATAHTSHLAITTARLTTTGS